MCQIRFKNKNHTSKYAPLNQLTPLTLYRERDIPGLFLVGTDYNLVHFNTNGEITTVLDRDEVDDLLFEEAAKGTKIQVKQQ